MLAPRRSKIVGCAGDFGLGAEADLRAVRLLLEED
jgi:hypothetical protein